jgi:hypothetical protein
MIPDGDRRHCAESSAVVNEPMAARMLNDDVVSVFVLNDDITDHLQWLLQQAPTHDIFERFLGGPKGFDIGENVIGRGDAPFNFLTRTDETSGHDGDCDTPRELCQEKQLLACF